MAAGLLGHLLPSDRKSAYTVSSAGTHAAQGSPASDQAVAAMKAIGIDIAGHRSRQVNKNLVEKADLILALSESHADFLKDHFPDASGKIFLLSEYAEKSKAKQDVPDPAGGNLEEYQETRDQIKRYIDKIVRKM